MSVVSSLLWSLFVGFNTLAIFYFLVLNSIYLFTSVVAYREMRRYARRLKSVDVEDLITSAGAPGVTVLAPAYNEELTCVSAVRSLLMLQYPDYEILIVNDGSRDATLARLADVFDLVPTPRFPTAELPTARVRGVYRSRQYPNLWVLDKENGGRSDALNAGVNYCRTPIFCRIDADSILEPDALMRVVRPFLEDATTVAAGGIVRVANGCTIEQGRVTSVALPPRLLPRFQVVEYLRAYLAQRVGWNALNATFILSGAFSIWKRSAVVQVGGFDPATVGEDMELTLRLHRHFREAGERYRITFVPDPVLWTEVPESMRDLGRQRDRWQRGLGELLARHRKMLFNPRYGRIGMVVMPYLFAFELVGPLVEFMGYFVIAFAVLTGLAPAVWLVAFLLLALVFGMAISIASVALEELAFRRYTRASDLVTLFGTAVLENFVYRQVTTFWRVVGLISFLQGDKGEGTVRRRGFSESPRDMDRKRGGAGAGRARAGGRTRRNAV